MSNTANVDFINQAKRIVGDADILGTDQDLSVYEHGARYGQGKAFCVIRPRNTEDLSAIIRLCYQYDRAIVPQGANTGLVGASTPDDSGEQVVISLDRFRKPLEVDAVNRTITVGAGVRLSDINTALEPYGLFFPIDLGADPSVGGMIGANTGGSRLIRYGDVRHNLLGIEAVIADENASVIHQMAGLRKNNTGLDFKQIFAGTGGGFGIVTKAVLEVHPLPQHRAAALVVPKDDDAIETLLMAFERRAGAWLSAFEGISKNAIEAGLEIRGASGNPFDGAGLDGSPDYCLLVELSTWERGEEAASRLDDFLAELVMEYYRDDGSGAVVTAVLNRPEVIWGVRHSISEGVARQGKVIAFDIACTRQKLKAFTQAGYALLAEKYPMVRVYDFGHYGDGGLHFNLVWPPEAGDYDPLIVQNIREDLYDLAVHDLAGSYSAEHGLGPHNQFFYDRYTGETEKMLAGGIKALFDPKGLLGRVRFSG